MQSILRWILNTVIQALGRGSVLTPQDKPVFTHVCPPGPGCSKWVPITESGPIMKNSLQADVASLGNKLINLIITIMIMIIIIIILEYINPLSLHFYKSRGSWSRLQEQRGSPRSSRDSRATGQWAVWRGVQRKTAGTHRLLETRPCGSENGQRSGSSNVELFCISINIHTFVIPSSPTPDRQQNGQETISLWMVKNRSFYPILNADCCVTGHGLKQEMFSWIVFFFEFHKFIVGII